MEDFEFLKNNIRAILLSLGKCATEREFRNAYLEMEGQSFDNVLRKYGMNSFTFFNRMPDVVKVHFDQISKMVLLTRVSGNAASSHMDNLTVNKYSKNFKGPKLKLGPNNTVRVLPARRPVIVPFVPRNYGNSFNPAFNFNAAFNSFRSMQLYQPKRERILPPSIPSTSKLSANARPYQQSQPKPKPRFTVPPPRPPMPVTVYEPKTPTPTPQPSAKEQRPQFNIVQPQPPVQQQQQPQFNVVQKSIFDRLSYSPLPPPYQATANNIPGFATRQQMQAPPPYQPRAADVAPILHTRPLIKYESSSNSSISSVEFDTKSLPEKRTTSATPPKKNPPPPQIKDITNELQDLNINPFAEKNKVVESPNEIKCRLSSVRLLKQAISEISISSNDDEDFKFGWQTVNYRFGEKAFFNIKIYDVVSPERFTFQFSFDKLESMMVKLNKLYSNLGDKLQRYIVETVKIGMLVAVYRNDGKGEGRWYRAEIMEANFDKLAIRYIDFYTVNKLYHHVKLSEVYHLEEEFANESPKSAFGRLHGIKPKLEFWCASSAFELSTSRYEILPATVKKYKNGKFAISIIIQQDDFNRMSDYMVQNEYADYDLEDFLHLSPKNQRSLV